MYDTHPERTNPPFTISIGHSASFPEDDRKPNIFEGDNCSTNIFTACIEDKCLDEDAFSFRHGFIKEMARTPTGRKHKDEGDEELATWSNMIWMEKSHRRSGLTQL